MCELFWIIYTNSARTSIWGLCCTLSTDTGKGTRQRSTERKSFYCKCKHFVCCLRVFLDRKNPLHSNSCGNTSRSYGDGADYMQTLAMAKTAIAHTRHHNHRFNIVCTWHMH